MNVYWSWELVENILSGLRQQIINFISCHSEKTIQK